MLADDADKPSELLFDEKGQYKFDSAPLPLYEGEPGTSPYLNQRLASESMALSHLLCNQAATPTSAAYLGSPLQNSLNVRLPAHLSPLFPQENTGERSPRHSPQILQASTMAPRYSIPSILTNSNCRFPEVSMTPTVPSSYACPRRPYDRPDVNDHQLLYQNLHNSPPPMWLPDYPPPNYPLPDCPPLNHPPPNHRPPNYLPLNHPLPHQSHAPYTKLPPLPGDPMSRIASLGDLRPFASATSQRPDMQAAQFISPTPTQYRGSYDLDACYPYQSAHAAPEISTPRSYSIPFAPQTPPIIPRMFLGSLSGGVRSLATMNFGSLSATQVSQVSSPEAREEATPSDADSDESDEERPPTAGPSSVRQTHNSHNTATSRHALTPSRANASAGLSWQEPLVGCLKTKGRTTSTSSTVAQRKRTVDDLDHSDAGEEPAKKRTRIRTPGKLTDDAVRSREYRAKHKNFGERVMEELGDDLPKNPTREDLQETLLEKFMILRSKVQAYEDEIGELRGTAGQSKT